MARLSAARRSAFRVWAFPSPLPTPPELALSVSGYFSIGSGHPRRMSAGMTYHISDSLHWIVGSHDLAIGGDFMRMDVDIDNTYRQNGNFRFTGTQYSGNRFQIFS